MTRNLFFISLLLTFLVGIASGQMKNQRDASGKKQGYWEAVDKNGNLVYSGYFKNDKPVGEMKRYHPGGKSVRVIMIYDNESEKAHAKFFWQNGEVAAEGNYINTKHDSTWIYYSYYTKKPSYRIEYTKGIRNGKSQSLYSDGDVAEETVWRDDKKNGPCKQYFDNKQLKSTVTYINDKLEGIYIAYYPDGKKETEGAYKNDQPDGKWVHYANDGKATSTIIYANGIITNIDELEASEKEFFQKVEDQKGRIKEPTIEDLMREAPSK